MQRLLALAPGGDRIVLVEPADVRQLLRQPGERRLALELGMDERGPGLGRERHDRPVDEPLVDDHEPLADIGELVAAGSSRIDPVQDPRRDPRHEDDPGGVDVSELKHPLPVPLRDEFERVVGGVLEPRLLHVRVEIGRVDEPRAPLVGALGDRADDRLHARLRLDRDDLPPLDVGAEVDREIGEALEGSLLHGAQDRRWGHETWMPSAARCKVSPDHEPL